MLVYLAGLLFYLIDYLQNQMKISVGKAANPMTVANKNLNATYSTSAAAVNLPTGTVNSAQGTVTYTEKTDSSNKFTVNSSTGAVTVAAGTTPGTYTYVITAKAAGTRFQ